MDLTFEFDPAKSKRNKLKHGIDFIEAQGIWNDSRAVTLTARADREDRFTVIARTQEVRIYEGQADLS